MIKPNIFGIRVEKCFIIVGNYLLVKAFSALAKEVGQYPWVLIENTVCLDEFAISTTSLSKAKIVDEYCENQLKKTIVGKFSFFEVTSKFGFFEVISLGFAQGFMNLKYPKKYVVANPLENYKNLNLTLDVMKELNPSMSFKGGKFLIL